MALLNLNHASAVPVTVTSQDISAFLSDIGRLNKEEKRDLLGDSALLAAIEQVIENTIDILEVGC